MGIQACAFDLGNTLSNDFELRNGCVESTSVWLQESGHIASAESFIKAYNRANRQNPTPFLSHTYGERVFFEEAFRELGVEDAEIVDQTFARYRELVEQGFAVAPETENALRALRDRGVLVGLLSNESVERVERFLDITETRPLFDSVVVSAAVGHEKPDLEIFRIALHALGTKGSETLMFGDNEVADGACKELGMRFVEVTGFRNPDRVFKAGKRHTPDESIDFVTAERVVELLEREPASAKTGSRGNGT